LDQNTARVFQFDRGEITELTSFDSGMKLKRKATGGTRLRMPYATHSRFSEKNEQSWRREILKKFFKKIMNEVRGADRVLLLGPGRTKSEFWHELADFKHFSARLEPELVSVDDVSDAQLAATIRDYFGSPSPRYIP
jgi:hypothetical protein